MATYSPPPTFVLSAVTDLCCHEHAGSVQFNPARDEHGHAIVVFVANRSESSHFDLDLCLDAAKNTADKEQMTQIATKHAFDSPEVSPELTQCCQVYGRSQSACNAWLSQNVDENRFSHWLVLLLKVLQDCLTFLRSSAQEQGASAAVAVIVQVPPQFP